MLRQISFLIDPNRLEGELAHPTVGTWTLASIMAVWAFGDDVAGRAATMAKDYGITNIKVTSEKRDGRKPWETQQQIVRIVTATIMNRIAKGEEPLRQSIEDEIQQFTDRLMEHAGWSEWPTIKP